MFEKGLLAGKRILVTGGGSGLGAAMGRRFVELGAELIICGRRLELLEAVAAELRSAFGGKVSVARCDIRDGAAVDAMMDQLWREAAIDVLVNNAAATFIAQTEQMSFRAADAILAPTLHGTMYCTLAAGRRWIEGKHKGVVLSILSTSTITGRAFTVPSAMAKSAVLAMTKSLAVEWGPKGVRTVAIAPGAFPTPGASGQLRPEGRDESWAQRNPLGRAGEHSELANLASFLISDQAGYINGEMVVQDGGSICAVPAPRTSCNGPNRNGPGSARGAPKARHAAHPAAVEPAAEDLVTTFPKRHFPAIHRAAWRDVGCLRGHLPVTMMREPVVCVANTDISGCDCGVVWGVIPRASTGRCFERRQGCGQACASTCTGDKADGGQAACEAGTGSDRRRRRRGTHLDRSVRNLGRLLGDAERQEGLLRAGEAIVLQNQSA